ncbi:MAG: radical SAM protein [Elusimicrobia bacterium]|nr:radical SAM protein [Elusimicrobiota bacterium]
MPRTGSGEEPNFCYVFPIGLVYIVTAMRQAGHSVDCLNLNHRRGSVEELVRSSLGGERRYDYLCTGGLSNVYREIRSIVGATRRARQGARIIVGGGIITCEPALMFEALKPDFVVIGEGERTIVELLGSLESGLEIAEVPGIGYRSAAGGFIQTRERAPIADLDSLAMPDYDGFGIEDYLDHMAPSDNLFYDLFDHPRVYPITCSRSCPFLCTFCFHPLGNKFRKRSVASVMGEVELMVRRHRINLLLVYDELFSNQRQWMSEFCRRITEFRQGLPWPLHWICQMRVDHIDEGMLRTMKEAGCCLVSYGFESYSEKVLKSMKKHIKPEQIERAIGATLRNHLSIQANFIFGDTLETSETVSQTLAYWKRNSHAGINLEFIRPYPGSELYHRCVERGIIGDKLEFIQDHLFDILNMTETMSQDEFERLKFDVYQAWLKHRRYASPTLLGTGPEAAAGFRVRCPYCGTTSTYRNYRMPFRHYFYLEVYCRSCRWRFTVASRTYRIVAKLVVWSYSLLPNGLKVPAFRLQKGLRFKALLKRYVFPALKV